MRICPPQTADMFQALYMVDGRTFDNVRLRNALLIGTLIAGNRHVVQKFSDCCTYVKQHMAMTSGCMRPMQRVNIPCLPAPL